MGLAKEDETPLADYRGTIEQRSVYRVTFLIENYVLKSIRVVSISDAVGILGRDILRGFTVTLRGKDQTFDVEDP